MTPLIVGALLAASAGPADTWVWTLYESKTSTTLAHEVPDTDRLAEVLACPRGGGAVKVTVYPGDAAGETLEQSISPADPAFQTFIKTGRFSVGTGDRPATILLGAKDMSRLARFGKLCGA